ncbi:MAG: stage II sporulation protein M [Candidatus Bathyarchaeota archaeon]|nr:stage II sporulation protein M [Candidatus Bathyarchaeota archaeon]
MKACLGILLKRSAVHAVMSIVYFGSIFVAVLWAQIQVPPPYVGVPVELPGFLSGLDWPLVVIGIFFFNLVWSSFIIVTLPGLVFFPLSAGVLVYRGFLWGLLLSQLPTSLFLVVLPTAVLEGEGYVLASVTGTILGMSWLKPDWVFKGEEMSRLKSFKKVTNECLRLYVLVIVLLFVAAVVETFTISSLTVA